MTAPNRNARTARVLWEAAQAVGRAHAEIDARAREDIAWSRQHGGQSDRILLLDGCEDIGDLIRALRDLAADHDRAILTNAPVNNLDGMETTRC